MNAMVCGSLNPRAERLAPVIAGHLVVKQRTVFQENPSPQIFKGLMLCIKWIINENLLYSTENSTQCSVVTSMGRKSQKRGLICTCIAGSLHCIVETNMTL